MCSIQPTPSILEVGRLVSGRVTRILPGIGLLITLTASSHVARVHITDIADDHTKNILSLYRVGQHVRAMVVHVRETTVASHQDVDTDSDADEEETDKRPVAGEKRLQIDLSLRPSRINAASPASTAPSTLIAPEITSFADLRMDQLVRGYVKSITTKGCFVSLNRTIVARCLLKNVSHTRHVLPCVDAHVA